MPGRRQQRPPLRVGMRWMAGALSVGFAAAAGAAILAGAGPATAAPTPNPSYHPGSDTATFTATGVLDSNCLISTGGTEVWIKPGDKINFKSNLAGINLGPLNLGTDKVVGMNVTAHIDRTKTSAGQTVSVSAGHVTVFPKTGQTALSTGGHTLTWTATSISVQSVGLLGVLGPIFTVPLSSSELKSGASLNWQGVIHVTNDAAKCKLSVGTPGVVISVGPVKVTVPPINVGVPVPTLPPLPGLPGGGTKTTPGGHQTTPGGGLQYTPPPLTVPEQAMGGIGSGGGFNGVLPDGASSTQLGTNLPAGSGSDSANSASSGKHGAKVHSAQQVDLASNHAPAAQLPVLLAIIAIVALSLVTATYARLYLLRRNT